MKQPKSGTTRASLFATAVACPGAFSSRITSGALLSVSLIGALALSQASQAATNTWTNTASDQNWDNPINWSNGHIPQVFLGFDEDAVVNATTGFPVITNDIDALPRDVLVGEAGGAGRLDHRGGIVVSGDGNYVIVGRGGGSTGTYNLANTAAVGPGLTGFAQGSGSIFTGDQLRVGAGDGTGTMNINTSGLIKVQGEFNMGEGGADATVKIDAGTIDVGSWFRVGWGGNGVDTLNMAGGSIKQHDGNAIFADGAGTGNVNQTAGTMWLNHDLWIGQNTGVSTVNLSGGSIFTRNGVPMAGRDGGVGHLNISGTGDFRSRRDFFIGQGNNAVGTVHLEAGAIANGSWVVIGRDGGSGTVDMSGGTWTKTGMNSNFIVASSGPGVMTQTGGLVDVQGGITWIGENGTLANASLTISNTAEWRTEAFSLAQNSTTGVLNLDGGTVRTHRFIGTRETNDTGVSAGTGTLNFNGSQIIATQSDSNFISTTVDSVVIKSGGMVVNSNGYNLTANQVITGTGNVVKSGAGTLSLLGANTYAGTNTVNAGGLVLGGQSVGSPSNSNPVVLTANTSFGVKLAFAGDQAVVSSLSFASGTSFNPDVGDLSGSNPTDATLKVTGAMSLTGSIPVNLKGTEFQTGVALPVLSYVPAQRSGGGTFAAGTLPPGVVSATFNDNTSTGIVSFTVTSYADREWTGNAGSNWTAANNWLDVVASVPANYVDKAIVSFNDNAAIGTVQVGSSVAPGSINVFNNTIAYALSSGGGKITGTTGLTKTGSGDLSITGLANDYTGVTRLTGGNVTIDSLTNGGVASSIGAATASPANLVLGGGGKLIYTGVAATINRGLTLEGSASLDTANNLSLSGSVLRTVATDGEFIKLGAGTLTLSGAENRLGALRPQGGSIVFDGTAGPQVNLSSALLLNNGASVTLNNNTKLATGDLTVGENSGSNTLTLNGNAFLETQNRVLLGDNTSTGTLILSGTSQIVQSGGWISVGQNGTGGTGILTVKDNASYYQVDSDMNITDNSNTVGTLNLQNNGLIDVNNVFWGKSAGTNATVNISGGTFNAHGFMRVGDNETSISAVNITGGNVNVYGSDAYIGQGGDALWTQSGGTANFDCWVVIGRLGTSDSVVNVSGGSFNLTKIGRNIIVAEDGKATINVSNTGVVSNTGGRIDLATRENDTGIVNVTAGGTLTARGISAEAHAGATSTLTLNNANITAAPYAYPNFMYGIGTATIGAGGVTINPNGQSLQLAQVFSGTGNLTKTGAGAIALDGVNTYGGTTTVSAGTLGGTGSVAGPLVVNSGAKLAPGHSVGTFTAGATTLSAGSTYAYEIDGATGDQLVVNGNLNVTGSTLAITQLNPASASSYVVASYTGTLTQPFAAVTLNGAALPAGWTLNYGTGTNSQITLTVPATPYTTWINGFPSILPADRDPGDDPDGDRSSNLTEFALDGVPNSGSNSGLTALLLQDTAAPTGKELTLIVAVRDGAVFAAGPNGTQVATKDGVTYTIQGSLNLTFPNSAVVKVGGASDTAAGTSLPSLVGTPWEYHTFRLSASEGLPNGSKGFLRVQVTAAP
ncbi:autotransporter-associated beta strand repeat-containing protein [Haloferula sp. BvORR071]|uniref:beta strand repeat-containing protein n=1 Tax=Haloferula sp. BvORR071 TaxID=1396141 RepID=UPI0005591BBF|nr:autotransporter-associated beta strand repeat-containing protein [Haloferula sp. BvORR071]